MTDTNVAGLPAKWRSEWKDADSTQLPDMNYLAAANELEAALAEVNASVAVPQEHSGAVAWLVRSDKVANYVTTYYGEAQTMARVRDGGQVIPLFTHPAPVAADVDEAANQSKWMTQGVIPLCVGAIRALLGAMDMQEKRETGAFHLTKEAARYYWDNAKNRANDVLATLEAKPHA